MELGKSSIKKFLICHENEYTKGDNSCLQELPLKPLIPIRGTDNYVSAYAYETFFGDYVEQLRVDKLAVNYEFMCETQDELDNFNDVIKNKINLYNSRFFYMNYFHPGIGWYFSKIYIGTPINSEAQLIETDTGLDTVTKITMSIIEVEGTKMFDQ